ncbi:hypothetical protein Ae201684P_021309 [Aphanomyces euteiches]|uniref:Uncharacterized protein n=1 Tax=Aphanomyces euteiches TaxID=100861 RepID=A0A6G0X721_9STRA|nr:hypothetical protein Ae201684_007797 [Aphanomyces euteiches]KAH9067142.1 hypothetical protein Ae201684P_021309 [Aphanomyces euteiches]
MVDGFWSTAFSLGTIIFMVCCCVNKCCKSDKPVEANTPAAVPIETPPLPARRPPQIEPKASTPVAPYVQIQMPSSHQPPIHANQANSAHVNLDVQVAWPPPEPHNDNYRVDYNVVFGCKVGFGESSFGAGRS